MPKLIAQLGSAIMLITWIFLSIVKPIVATTAAREQARHDCPKLKVTHGVGSDLRTFKRAVDLCAHR